MPPVIPATDNGILDFGRRKWHEDEERLLQCLRCAKPEESWTRLACSYNAGVVPARKRTAGVLLAKWKRIQEQQAIIQTAEEPKPQNYNCPPSSPTFNPDTTQGEYDHSIIDCQGLNILFPTFCKREHEVSLKSRSV